MDGWSNDKVILLNTYFICTYIYVYIIYITIALNSAKHPQTGTCSLNMGFLEAAQQHLYYKPCNFEVPCSVSFFFFFGTASHPVTQSQHWIPHIHNVMYSQKYDSYILGDFWLFVKQYVGDTWLFWQIGWTNIDYLHCCLLMSTIHYLDLLVVCYFLLINKNGWRNYHTFALFLPPAELWVIHRTPGKQQLRPTTKVQIAPVGEAFRTDSLRLRAARGAHIFGRKKPDGSRAGGKGWVFFYSHGYLKHGGWKTSLSSWEGNFSGANCWTSRH